MLWTAGVMELPGCKCGASPAVLEECKFLGGSADCCLDAGTVKQVYKALAPLLMLPPGDPRELLLLAEVMHSLIGTGLNSIGTQTGAALACRSARDLSNIDRSLVDIWLAHERTALIAQHVET